MIYADNAATTKICAAAKNALLPFLDENYGNPSSLHSTGQKAAECLEKARADIAECIGAKPCEIYFTSGGSEADNQAILTGAKYGIASGKKHIISQKTEHHAVLRSLERLEKQGFEITLLDVDSNGLVSVEDVRKTIREDTVMVSVMTANNEIGTIMPIKEIAKVCREKSILFHTDAVQAVGHIPVNVNDLGCDMLSISAHKFGGMKGVGVLYCRKNHAPAVLVAGGNQERGFRAGTENLPGICAMAAALKEKVTHIEKNSEKVAQLSRKLITGLQSIPRSVINGSLESRLPGNINVCFEGIEGESLLLMLDAKGICASAGSACNSGSLAPSYVLKAIGVPDNFINGALRLSFSEDNTLEEVDYVISSIKETVEYLRSISPIWNEK